MSGEVLLERVRLVAQDLGRLRRVLPDELEYAGHLVDRLAAHVEVIDGMLRPTASELVRELRLYEMDDVEAVREALQHVDRERAQLRQLLGRGAT